MNPSSSRDMRHEEWNNDEDALLKLTFYILWEFGLWLCLAEFWVVVFMQVKLKQQVPPGVVFCRCSSLRGIRKLTGQELNNKNKRWEQKNMELFFFFLLPLVQFQEFASLHSTQLRCCKTQMLYFKNIEVMDVHAVTFSNSDTFNSHTRALKSIFLSNFGWRGGRVSKVKPSEMRWKNSWRWPILWNFTSATNGCRNNPKLDCLIFLKKISFVTRLPQKFEN